mgnify:FL=1
MKKFFAVPPSATQNSLMAQAGFKRHCIDSGRTCYHRRIHDPAFPRFHALVAVRDGGFELHLHFDAHDLNHRGNHGDEWAYTGERVNTEMRRIANIFAGNMPVRKINGPNTQNTSTTKPHSKKRSIFEILFR